MSGWTTGDDAGHSNHVSAFTAWDSELAGLLRFASCERVFPVSIAYPAWSHPVPDLDAGGNGTVAFPAAFTLRREPLTGPPTAEILRAQAMDGFRRRERERHAAARMLGLTAALPVEPWHAPGRTWVAVGHGARQIRARRLLWADGEEVYFPAPPADPSFWRITVHYRDLPPEQFRRILRSFAWLDPLWFSATPSF